jgi:glycosyltransferase involved in cell wall biosynthesis
MNDKVTVIMSVYKRPHTFDEQYSAIKNQTHKNIKTVIWANQAENVKIPSYILENSETIYSQNNHGVWGRFKVAQSICHECKFFCIIDDDTIPGYEWIENCIETIDKNPGVITTRGVILEYGRDHIYPSPQSYTAHGWCNPNEEPLKVDFGCHSWFFNSSLLYTFWKHAPRKLPMNYGEDMHLSYIAQKDNLSTYVAPHPISNAEMWGSNPRTGHEYGSDKNAISWNNEANSGMNEYYNYLKKYRDFKIIAET